MLVSLAPYRLTPGMVLDVLGYITPDSPYRLTRRTFVVGGVAVQTVVNTCYVESNVDI